VAERVNARVLLVGDRRDDQSRQGYTAANPSHPTDVHPVESDQLRKLPRPLKGNAVTDLLTELHHNFGLLDITISTMDKARQSWASALGPVQTDAELLRGKFAENEPVLIVRSKAGCDWNTRDADENDLRLFADDPRGIPSKAKVWEISPDEFHYFKAFRTGISDLATEMPAFFHGMTLAHAWGIFEHYLGSLLLRILETRPEILGREKQINIGELFDHPTKESLLATVAEREVRSLFYQSVREWLKALRRRYGLRELTNQFDDQVVETALIRNCVVHNRSMADGKLAKHSGGKHAEGTPIEISQTSVFQATTVLRKLASAIDEAAIQAHFTAPTSERPT
jgi:hypothetical protein